MMSSANSEYQTVVLRIVIEAAKVVVVADAI
jgi:hypothetical protein